MQFVYWGVPILAAILVLAGVYVVWRRRRSDRESGSQVFPPPSSGESAQVRLLEGDEVANEARVEALRGEVKSLRREAQYAAQRGLDRRAERLQSLIAEREEQLSRYDHAS